MGSIFNYKLLRGFIYPTDSAESPMENVVEHLNQHRVRNHLPPLPYEPMRRNRFFVTLPEHVGIPPQLVESVTGIGVRINETNPAIRTWNDVVIGFYDTIPGQNPRQRLNELMLDVVDRETMNIGVDMLDPTGV